MTATYLSLDNYLIGRQIELRDYPFYAIIQAAMRRADTDNLEKLRTAWPEVWDDLQARYMMADGVLPSELENCPLCKKSHIFPATPH